MNEIDIFTLVAKLTMDSSEYESGINKMKADTEKAADSIKKKFLTATKVGAAAIVAFGASSVKTGAEFDSSMSQVAATMGTTVDQIEDLREFAQQMGASTAFSAREAADALNYMALAGYDSVQSMEALPNVLNLAAAGGIDLASASDMVTDAQSALGLSMEESAELVDKMAKASSKSNTSVAQLGDAILTVGGTAKNLAGGTTELSTALGILADNGIKGAEGGTALRNVILSLAAPTDNAALIMESLGLKAYDAQGDLRPLEDIFTDLNGILSDMTQGEQTEVLNTLFNKVDLKSANALLATSADRWGELSDSIDNAQGAAQAMAETQLDNLEGDITLLKSAFEGLQIQISDKLSPAFRGAVQWITTLIENFETVGPIIAGVSVTLGVFAVAINIGSIIQKTTVAFAAFNTILAANPIGLVVAAIAGLVAAITLLWNTNENFRNFVLGVFESIKNGIFDLADKINEFMHHVEDLMDAGIEQLKKIPSQMIEIGGNMIQGLIDGVKSRVTDAVNTVKDVAGNIVGTVKNILGIHSPSTVFEDVGENIVAGLSQGIEGGGLDSSAKYLGNYTKGLGDNVTKQLPAIQKAGTSIMTSLQTSMDNYRNTKLKNFIPNVIQTITTTLASRHGDIIQSGVDIIIRLIEGMNNTLGTLVNAVHTIVSRMVTTAHSRYGDFVRTGEYFIEGLWEGMENRSSWLESRIDSYISYIKSWVDSAFGIWSPSRWAKSRGDYIMQGLSLGMENGLDGVLDTAQSVTDKVKDSLDFGTQSVDFASSGLGASSAAMVNGIAGSAQGGGSGTLTVNLVLDGRVLASTTLQDFINVANANGTPIYTPA